MTGIELAEIAWPGDAPGQALLSLSRSPVGDPDGFLDARARWRLVRRLGRESRLAATLAVRPRFSSRSVYARRLSGAPAIPCPGAKGASARSCRAQVHHNKILWVPRQLSRTVPALDPASAHGRRPTWAHRSAGRPDGPGPSIVDAPSAGCWRLTLSWSGRRDTVDLRYATTGLTQAEGPIRSGGCRRAGRFAIILEFGGETAVWLP